MMPPWPKSRAVVIVVSYLGRSPPQGRESPRATAAKGGEERRRKSRRNNGVAERGGGAGPTSTLRRRFARRAFPFVLAVRLRARTASALRPFGATLLPRRV